MKSSYKILPVLVFLVGTSSNLRAQGTAFTYQGRLSFGGVPASGVYDMKFAVFTTNFLGVPLTDPAPVPGVSVSNGLFSATVDLGVGVFSGLERWLEISVRTNSSNDLDPYTTLVPRQKITASPYAIYAGASTSADALNGTLPASQIAGSIAPANIAPGTITSLMLAPGAVSMLGAPDGSPTNAVVVDNDGNVGIGTDTPAAALDVMGILRVESTNGTRATLMQVDQGGNLAVANSLTVSTNARVSGLVRSGSESGTSQAPNPAGLVVRRINSTLSTSNSVVAVVHTLFSGTGTNITLVRDGTAGGFQIHYPALPGYVTIACMGIDTNGVSRNFYVGKPNPATAGTVQIFSNAQAIVHFECTFGNTYNGGDHLTRVTLSRFYSGVIIDNFWSGDLVSTYNQ